MSVTDTRPEAAVLRKLNQESERRLPITHGWYARGKTVNGEWTPELGTPADLFVYLDMGDQFVREAYSTKGFLPLSTVPAKGTANIDPGFAVRPPDYDLIVDTIEKIRARRGEAIAAIEEELIEVEEALSQPAGLMGGEAAQLRRKKAGLNARIEALKDDRNYDARDFYRQMVRERQAVVRSQIPEAQVIALALEREEQGWEANLKELEREEARGTASTSASETRRTSTRRSEESPESSDSA